jgi:biopolymer transport protein ExbB/TolQ
MSLVAVPLPAAAPEIDRAYDPVLRWLIFSGVSAFAAVALWRYGLIRLVVVSDRTRLTSVIALVYVAASLHSLVAAIAISREAAGLARLRRNWASLADPEALAARLPRGLFGEYLGDLLAKGAARGAGRLDQTLLLRALSERLRRGLALGGLAADTMIKLGLLGTIVGFILMLGPISGLKAEDEAAVRAAMSVMSEGMSVAMYTTLAGLVGSILLRAQYFMLEAATASAFWELARLAETRLIPALERRHV